MNTWECKFTLQGMSGFFTEIIQATTSIDAQKIIETKYGHKTTSFTFRLLHN